MLSHAETILNRMRGFQAFVERLLPTSPTAATAKKRLQMLKLQDRGTLTPRECAELKRQIQEVCAAHGGINADELDLRLDNQDGRIAVIASIPVKAAVD